MTEKRETVSLVIPLYNEEEMIPLLIKELELFKKATPELKEVVFINDGSIDQTKFLLKKNVRDIEGYKLIDFSRNFGHQIAVTAGLDFVESDSAVIIDADLQDPLPVVNEMILKWKEGFDVVYGIRTNREGESFFKKVTSKWFYRFFRWITDLDIPIDTGDFRLISKEVIEAYKQVSEQQPFVRGVVSWLGYNQIGIEYERKSRMAGSTKYPFKKMMKLAINAITSFSDKPLRIATQVGLWTSFLAFLGIIWALVAKFFMNTTVPGWTSSLMIILFLGGVQIIFLGVIGTYLTRIYAEVRNRPRYLVKEIWKSDSKEFPQNAN